jgi:hypothetical protein
VKRFRVLMAVEVEIGVEDDESSGLTHEERAHEEAGHLVDMLKETLSYYLVRSEVGVAWVKEIEDEAVSDCD